MEPQLPSPSHAPEKGPAHFSGGEAFTPASAPERAPAQPERQETREQHRGGPSDGPAVAQALPAVPPLPTVAPPTAQTTAVQTNSNPAVAADEDLIEKEWVEKAKKVIADTKHDPHLQETEVSKLQADYLQKRYGKTVKLPSDG